jgi:hypothetical protein
MRNDYAPIYSGNGLYLLDQKLFGSIVFVFGMAWLIGQFVDGLASDIAERLRKK